MKIDHAKLKITHPNEEDTREMLNLHDYKYLGYQNGWKHVHFDELGNITEDNHKARSFGYLTKDYPEYGACRDAKHKIKDMQHNSRGSNCTYWCIECKIFWKVDMSD